jgi:hypothetical protein
LYESNDSGGKEMTFLKRSTFRPWLIKGVVSLLFLSFALLIVPSALAHTRVEVGPYAIVVGWFVEPPVVGERNAVTIEVTKDEQPVLGVDGSLDIEFLYGGRTFRANLNQTDTIGLYTAEIFPTVRGQYAVRVFGEIEEISIDEILEPEEVFPASRIQFPEPEPDMRELVQRIEFLESELQSARLASYIGIGVGAAGLIIGAIGFILQRRN